jgi:diketogulonate reductase-like aldo/keto reductase
MDAAPLPPIIYGTAWKQDATAGLVKTAARAGYRGLDTANQKKHYREDFLGEALAELAQGGIPRSQLFLQTKYTSQDGQDHRLPYDPAEPPAAQVRASFASSLKNLRTDYLDSFLVHGPSSSAGLIDEDWEIWAEFERLHASGGARLIGVSNVALHHLTELSKAKVKPMVVQNRCYAVRGWDRAVREHCAANGIIYQGFSLLTANPHVVEHRRVEAIARRMNATAAQVVFRFAKALGILPLTGTTDERHMQDDLAALALELTAAEVDDILAIPR